VRRTALFGPLVIASALGCASASAQDSQPSLQQRIDAAHEAEERGGELFARDRAISLAVAAWNGEARGTPGESLIALSRAPDATGRVEVSLYGDSGGPERLARYAVDPEARSATLVARQNLDAPAEPDPGVGQLLAAYETALAAEGADHAATCAGLQRRTIVLPARTDGTVSVYRLTTAGDPASVQLGRSDRYDIAADGSLKGHEVLVAGCETIAWDAADDELAMRAHFTTHRGGPQPNEIHAYAGHFMPFPLGVVTGNLVWPVLGGSIADPVEADPEMIAQ
jgi:hypothetical protein